MIIDSKVVEAKFDNSQFLKGVSGTLKAMADLQKGLQLPGASKGLAEITAAANKVDLSNIAASTEHIASKFNAMTAIATASLTALVMDATRAGADIARGLGLGAITEGWSDYNLKIGATQTIMAGTGEGIQTVTKYLKELDIYADETIYSLSDMVGNIGKFTNAGVKLPKAVSAMKGIAQVAALSGANTGEAARAMYNLGQAIGQGTVRMMDWRSVELANMGTKEFKEQLIDSALAMGTLKKSSDGTIKSLEGNEVNFKTFSTTLQDKWLTSEALIKTLNKYSDATTNLGKKATKAATEIKTLPMLMTTLTAAMGTGWTDTFELMIGDLPEAVKLWTKIGDTVGDAVGRSADARNKVLADFDKMGGRKVLIKGLGDAFNTLLSYFKPIRDGFRDIFPRATAEGLFNAAKTFRDFFQSIKLGEESAENLRRTFAGVFAVFGIGWEIIKQVVSSFFDLWGSVSEGSDGFLDATAGVGDFLVELHKAIQEGDGLKRFFDGLVKVLRVPLTMLRNIATFFGEMFSAIDLDGVDRFSGAMGTVGRRITQLQAAGNRVLDFFERVGDVLGNVGHFIGDKLGDLGNQVAKAFTATNFSMALDAINTGLLAAIVVMIRKMFTGGLVKVNVGEGMFTGIKTALTEVTNTMKSMQQQIQAETILKIAIALGILATSLLVLSTIDDKKLTKALIGASIGMGGLMFALKRFTGMLGVMQTIKLPIVTASLVLLSIALLGLATALKIFASIDGPDIFQSLFSMSAGLLLISQTMKLMPKDMVLTAAGLTILGVALNLIAVAMKIFGTMDILAIGQALVAMGLGLTLISQVMKLMPKDMVITATGLTILGVALNLIAAAMKIFGTMDPEQTGKALLALGGALVIIAASMRLMPSGPNMILQAVALNAVAVALNVMAVALAAMGAMSWSMIVKGLVTLGGAMLILAIGLNLMSGTLAGSAALMVAALALAVLTPVLITLGSLSFGTIITGLLALAGIFLVLGLAGLVLQPLVPAILGLSVAILLIGAGMALAGAGTLMFVMALAVLAGMFKALGTGIWNFFKGFIVLIPAIFAGIAKGIIEFAKIIARSGPAFARAFAALIEAGLDAIIKNVPKAAKAFLIMITTALRVITTLAPKFYDAALDLIEGFLKALADHLPGIIEHGADIVVALLEGLAEELPRMQLAAADLVISFLNGLAETIREKAPELGEAGANLASAIVEGIITGLFSFQSRLGESVRDLASNMLQEAKNFLGIKSPSKEFKKVGQWAAKGLAQGLVGGKEEVLAAWEVTGDLLRSAIDSVKYDIDTLEDSLKSLREGKENAKQRQEIAKTEAALKRSRSEYERLKAAQKDYNKHLDDERNRLLRLGSAYDRYTAKIEAANEKLKDAIQTRNDYNKSIAEQYSDVPDITAEEESNVGAFVTNIEKQLEDTKEFAAVLQRLRKKGLNDAMYKELLAKGPEALDFAQELDAGGKDSIKTVNNLQSELAKVAKSLGSTASKELYQAGVNSAQGLVNGLKKKRSAIRETMEDIARSVVKALRKELKIKSPSRETFWLGDMVTKGMIEGLVNSRPQLDRAATSLGEDTVTAMKASISRINDALDFDTTLSPTITPVLDLSVVEKEAGQIGSLLSQQQISLDAAYSKATYASNGHLQNQEAATTTSDEPRPPAEFSYTQNNYSPKALPPAEIYRRTKNQISTVKGALTDATT